MADKRSTYCHTICYGVGEIDFTEECLYFCIEWSSAYDDFNEVSSEHFLCLLTEKSALCALHTAGLGIKVHLSALDAALMRLIYQKKYAKRKG